MRKVLLTLAFSATALFAAGNLLAQTINYIPSGGNINTAANWEFGALPMAGETGLVEVDADWPSTNGAGVVGIFGDLVFDGTTAGGITVNSGPANVNDIIAANPSSITFGNLVTVNSSDDIFTGGPTGNYIFEAGSTTNVNDDFEANGQGTITINGGTHSVGLASPNTGFLGAQQGSTLNFFGGTVDTQGFRTTAGTAAIPAGGTINVDCDASLTTGEVTLDASGSINFNSTWSGSLTNTAFSGSDWQNLLSSAANGTRTLDGNDITSGTAFDGSVDGEFQITNGGQTLSIVNPAEKASGVLKGDVNMDGEVTFLDISPFILALSLPDNAPAEADCNCDGIVSFLDISPFILKLTGLN